jgi:hypothetical protein
LHTSLLNSASVLLLTRLESPSAVLLADADEEALGLGLADALAEGLGVALRLADALGLVVSAEDPHEHDHDERNERRERPPRMRDGLCRGCHFSACLLLVVPSCRPAAQCTLSLVGMSVSETFVT